MRGIESSGLPLLPSRLLYDRGVAYSYAAWLGGAIVTPSLPTYRAVGYLAAVAALVALFSLVRTVASSNAAWLAVALTAVTLPFVAVATTARFYAPFLLLYLLTLRTLVANAGGRGPGPDALPSGAVVRVGDAAQPSCVNAWPLVGIARPVVSRARNPRARVHARRRAHRRHAVVPTIATPRVGRILGGRDCRARCRTARAGGASSVASVAAPVAVAPVAAAASEPPSMLTRFFVWQVVNLIEWPLDPLDFFAHIARSMPGLTIGVLALFAMRLIGKGAPWTGPERFAHVLWVGWVLFFGVIDSGITINYLLLPVTLMVAALSIDLAAVVPARRFAPIAALLVATIAAEQWGSPAPGRDPSRRGAPHDCGAGGRRASATLPHVPSAWPAPTSSPVCCSPGASIAGWPWTTSSARASSCRGTAVRRACTPGGRSPARCPSCSRPRKAGRRQTPCFVIDVFKELPVGPSSRFLERALTETPFATRIVSEDSRMRVLEIRSIAPSPADR